MILSRWLVCGAMVGGLGVILGAFGAHGLKGVLEAQPLADAEVSRRMALYETAVRYQMVHAPVLILIGMLLGSRPSKSLRVAAWSLLAGLGIFSGSLYVLTFSNHNWRWLGAVVPVGGVLMVVGWMALALASRQRVERPEE